MIMEEIKEKKFIIEAKGEVPLLNARVMATSYSIMNEQ